MKRQALVTGACGFVGGHLVEQLLTDGWDVRATDLPESDRSRLPGDAAWAPSDLTRRESVPPVVEEVDVVFHAAHVYDASAPWDKLYRVNVLGTEYLLEAAHRAKVQRVVSRSSCRVYGKVARDRMPIDETHPVRPRDSLGRSMAMQDAVVWRYHESGLPATLLRPSLPYGAKGRGGLTEVLRRLNRLPVVPVPVNHMQRVSSVHVKDLVRAASFVAEKEETAGEEYNITDDGRYSFAAFLSLLAQGLGKRTLPILAPRALVKAGAWIAALGSFDFVPSNSKIKSLDFRFVHPDPSSGIPETIEELRREGYLE
jgi:nucleoside-diphosphate-sugar epimerase